MVAQVTAFILPIFCEASTLQHASCPTASWVALQRLLSLFFLTLSSGAPWYVAEHATAETILEPADPHGETGMSPAWWHQLLAWALESEGKEMKSHGTTVSWYLNFPTSFKLWQSLIHPEWHVLVKALAEHQLCIMLVVCYNRLMAPFDLVRTSL